MSKDCQIPNAIQALSALSGVSETEVAVQVAAIFTAVGGPHAGMITLADEFQPVGFHLLNLGGDSARQRRLIDLLFTPLRFIQEDLLSYSRLAPVEQLNRMSSTHVEGRRSDEHLLTEPTPESVEGAARRDVYHLADLSSQAVSRTSPWQRLDDVDQFQADVGCRTMLPVDGIHGYLPGHPMLSQSYVGRNEGECLRNPVVFLDNPDLEMLRKPPGGFDRDAPLILDESARLWEGADRAAATRKIMERVLCDRTVSFSSATPAKDRLRSSRPRLFSIISKKLGGTLLSNPGMESSLTHVLLGGHSADESASDCEVNPEQVSAGYRNYRETLNSIVRLRRIDALGLWSSGMSDSLALEFHLRQREFVERLNTVDAGIRQFVAAFSNFPTSLLWTLLQLEQAREVTKAHITLAMDLAETAMKCHLSAIRELRRDAASEQVERKAAEMLGKILEVEPCSIRDLMRKYPVQRLDVHEPILKHLIETGKVMRLESNKIRLADEARIELTTGPVEEVVSVA